MTPVVSAWKPPFKDALKLARRPAIAFLAFAGGGIVAAVVTILAYNHSPSDLVEVPLSFGAGLLGVPVGQALSLFRIRTAIVLPAWAFLGTVFLIFAGSSGLPSIVVLPVVLGAFGFMSGFLSLQHRWELFAAFLPALGWVGSVMVILNEEGRVSAWQDEKLSAWLPIPLLLLLGFVVSFGAYLLQKQTFHLELWQLLGGAPSRRLVHKGRGKIVVGKRALLSVLGLGLLLFVFTAVVSPYLWRTGRGDRDGGGGGDGGGEQHEPGDGDPFDVEGLKRALEEFAEQARDKSTWLLPFLPAFLLERPIRRWIQLRHLRRPFWRKANTDRIEDLWHYLRVGLADAGHEPRPAESVEETTARLRREGRMPAGLEEAASIYARTRYGLGVRPGDLERLQALAVQGFAELRAPLSFWQKLKRAYTRVDA